ncbi:hypothetical protein PVK06_019440 [Gossypium arboreum]|uniref:Uncharacterized protein n=1 Tax=Gossypium arboreum TaxID=29729 RepID=A0ABR0PJP8_GOSAR|nr:hypothetical protein PVK06_019440 [Gossypium arboreum]
MVEHVASLEKIIKEWQDQVEATVQKQSEALENFKKKTTKNFLSSILKLKMNILLHAQVTDGPFYAHKVDFNALYRVDMSELSFDMLFPLAMHETHLLEAAVFPCELQYDSWSFALTNSIRNNGSSSVSFSMTGGSFAFANCVGGCGSSAVNLNITAVSFVLANYVGGYGFSPMSLNMTGRALLSQIVLKAATLRLQALI